MRKRAVNPEVLFRLQKFVLPLSGVLFGSTIYIVHADFGKMIPKSVSTLIGFDILTFLLS